jgi:hypothetical protein
MTRAHMQKGGGSRRLEKQYQTKEDMDWAEVGPGQSAQAGRPSPFRGPVVPPSRAIYSPLTESHALTNSSSAAEEQRSLRDTILEMRVMLVV